MAADDLITFEELRARLSELDYARMLAERELKALRNQEELICKLEAPRDTLLNPLMDIAPDALDSLTPEKRHHVYGMLNLGATVGSGWVLEISGAFGEKFTMCNSELYRQPFQAAQDHARTPGQRFGRVREPQLGHAA